MLVAAVIKRILAVAAIARMLVEVVIGLEVAQDPAGKVGSAISSPAI
jgi:hypothetical protein